MKKTIFITFGIILILLIIGVWVYLFAYGAPRSGEDVFSRFGFGDNEPLPTMDTSGTVDVSEVTDSGEKQKLRQLTVRPVAGAAFTNSGILYVEEGTGHIYHIDLGTGEEKLMSGTTIQGTRDAVFSEDGSYVAITSTKGSGAGTVVGLVDGLSGKLSGVSLPSGAAEIAFGKATNTVMYLVRGEKGSSGYSYDIERGVGTEIFRTPLRDIHVLWGEQTYVYTTPTALQIGYLYRARGNTLEYVYKGGLGLVGLLYDEGLVFTTVNGTGVSSVVLASGGTTTSVSLPLIPEKCTNNEMMGGVFYCGIPSGLSSENFPDKWYMGSVSFSDTLFSIDVETDEVLLLSDFVSESGREVDISKIGTDVNGDRIYFINKNDNTLWMYDTTL